MMMAHLWREVENWKDENAEYSEEESCWWRIKRCLPRR
jgi:hypothetical protein